MLPSARRLETLVFLFCCACCTCAQRPNLPGSKNGSATGQPPAATGEQSGQQGSQGGDSKSASGTSADGARQPAGPRKTSLGPLDPASPPPRAFARPRIGLALGGGGALALTEIGALEWFEQHHIPVDVVAGTSMGCMVGALYSTGLTPAELTSVMNDRVFAAVFTFSNSYQSRSFRRREDSQQVPNGITIGLKHRVSFRNSLLTDQGLNAFLDRHFLRYDDQTDFNTLPIPLRCISTDLNDAVPVTFARGSIPDAVRASVSLPGVFQPFEMNGHEYVDGGVLENLPTATIKNMQAEVVLAFSIPIAEVGQGDLKSILGVLGRSASVAIEGAEREQRKLADVVMIPDIQGFGAGDYLKTVELSRRGYAAAEAHRGQLLQYALNDADWSAYLAHRASLRRGPAGPVLRVRVTAPTPSATLAIQRLFAPLVNQPVDTAKIEALLDQVRADGRYEADYTVGYETPAQFAAQTAAQTAGRTPLPQGTIDVPVATRPDQLPAPPAAGTETKPDGPEHKGPGAANPKPGTAATSNQPGVAKTTEPVLADRPGAPGLAATQAVSAQSLADVSARPILLVTVADKKTGPPNLIFGANLQAQAAGLTHATVEAILLNQDLGGYGSELRSHIRLGYLTQVRTEYFRPLSALSSPQRTFFVAPRAGFLRQPFPIYADQQHVSGRQLQRFSAGGDLGWTNQRTQEIRAGLDFSHISWTPVIGTDSLPNLQGQSQRARVLYQFDTQDRALVPQFGLRLRSEAAFLYNTVASSNAPQITTQASFAHRFRALEPATIKDKDTGETRRSQGKNVVVFAGEFGTSFHRNLAQPFRYTLGGPLRLSASAIDQYRATDYFLLNPGVLRRLAQLPQPLGQSIYAGLAVEGARIFAPDARTLNRADLFLGLVAETPLGVVTFGPALGTNGERKFTFTLGRLF